MGWLALLPGMAAAQTPILLALRQQAWPMAQALASANPDPVAGKLVTFIRMLNPGQAGAGELLDFMAANPDWPDRDVLARRYAEALADEPDARRAAGLCRREDPALFRCADAWALLGAPALAVRAARQAWVALPADPDREADALARWGGVLTASDQFARFERLEAGRRDGAARQAARLSSGPARLAAARLALRQRDPDALDLLPGVPAEDRADPALLLAQARYLRRGGADAAALALWHAALGPAEALVAPARRGEFWTERDALARALLAAGDADGAYWLADDPLLPPESAADARSLAGWIALRRLHDPSRAAAQFRALAEGTRSAISQARAHYWLARAAADPATADPAVARAELDRAAAWPTTYYGQLAARAAGLDEAGLAARIAALGDPAATRAEADAFDRGELSRAATVLAGWADGRRAADFLRQLAQPPASPGRRALTAQLALRLGVPEAAVQAARLAGRDGAVLAGSGWPAPVAPPPGPVPPALVLAVARQESSFDPHVTSAAGAVGLMQVMPDTAAGLARAQHAQPGSLTDATVNLRWGTAYLASLLARFGGTVPYAVAAYNAGPRRVREWLAAGGDPAAGSGPAAGNGPAAGSDTEAMVDWIEQIPFAETRNYVQRVLENAVVYRARSPGGL